MFMFISFFFLRRKKKETNQRKKHTPLLGLRSGQCNCFAVAPSSRDAIFDGYKFSASRTRYRSNTLADNAPHINYSYYRHYVRCTFITLKIVRYPNPTFSEQSRDVVFHSLSSLSERFY